MPPRFNESVVEEAALAWLESAGWQIAHGPDIAPDMPAAERRDYGEVVLGRRLRDALERLNPQVPAEALKDTFRKLTRPEGAELVAHNRGLHRLLVDGMTSTATPAARSAALRPVSSTSAIPAPHRREAVLIADAPGGEVVVYEAPYGEVRVEVLLERETVWLSLTQMAELFGRDKSVISRHLRNVFASGELERRATIAKNATVLQMAELFRRERRVGALATTHRIE